MSPTYIAYYTNAQGKTIKRRIRRDADRPDVVTLRGVQYRYDDDRTFGRCRQAAAVCGGRNTDTSVCEALSVIPQQREEAIQHALGKGLKGFNFDEQGTLSFESDRARRDYLLAYNHYDKNAGYRGVNRDRMHEYRENRREE